MPSVNDFINLGGWSPDERAVEDALKELSIPRICYAEGIKGTGAGKTVLLYQYLNKLVGRFNVRLQTIGDCVSMGAACAVDVLRCVQHYVLSTGESWIAECATEPIYAGSRVEIAGGALGGGDGSNGIWAAKWVKQYGILLRQKYGNIDLTTYSGQKARQWGMPRAGVPDELEPIAKLHPVKQYSQVRTWEEARDALANGYPITIASGAGFSSTRDKDGFARPSGSWAHQMALIAVKDDGRPGALINNSWGPNWIGGPKGEYDIPDGSFWCDANVLERNILSAGDSWAFSNFEGFPPQKLNLEWF